jgi:hypothetical protein
MIPGQKGYRPPEYFIELHRKAVRKKAQKKRRKLLSKQGRCHRCKELVGEDRIGKNLCRECQTKGTKNSLSWKARRIEAWKALGLCVHCEGKREAVPGTTLCAYCVEQDYEARLIRIAAAKEKGTCARCFDPEAIHGFFKSTGKRKKYCIACLNKYNNDKRHRQLREISAA